MNTIETNFDLHSSVICVFPSLTHDREKHSLLCYTCQQCVTERKLADGFHFWPTLSVCIRAGNSPRYLGGIQCQEVFGAETSIQIIGYLFDTVTKSMSSILWSVFVALAGNIFRSSTPLEHSSTWAAQEARINKKQLMIGYHNTNSVSRL